ncbi:MAG: hypothetical protein QM790_09755 [Nibricoccus sp.]
MLSRSEFLKKSAQLACGTCAATILGSSNSHAAEAADKTPTPVDEALKKAQYENTFTKNWMADLFAAIDTDLEPAAKLKLMEACGRGCFNRHKFKQDIAEAGKGDVDKLVEAYRTNYGIKREGNLVHISYGGGCYCPAAWNRAIRPNDLHCECTRFTHETIFRAALGRHVPVEVVESIRRGGQKCHLIAHLS